MRSSSGAYFAGLDHVRGLAAFMVVVWHFTHWTKGSPVPFNQAPWLGPLDEGHLGVAVFMTLSGYLFAKLVGDKKVLFWPFLWNRAIRLLPLLAFTLLIAGFLAPDKSAYLKLIVSGLILPKLPNGGWSITAEVHFYILLPLLLFLLRKSPRHALGIVLAMILLRIALSGFDIRTLAYMTIIGRLDQFVLGMTAFYVADRISGKTALAALAGLWIAYAIFDAAGGFYNLDRPQIWTFWTTLEGLTIAPMIAWYDRNPLRGRWTGFLELAGKYSYSIYLFHFFYAENAAILVNEYIVPIPTLIQALPWALAYFAFMMLVGHATWTFIEKPALRFRTLYLADPEPAPTQALPQQSS